MNISCHKKPFSTASEPSPWAFSSVIWSKLWQAHNNRVTRSKGQGLMGKFPHMVNIHLCPLEIEARLFPGHWKGELIKGKSNVSAMGTFVERTRRLLMLVKLPEVKRASALNLLQGFKDNLLRNALPLRQILTYNEGREIAMHKKMCKRNGITV
jgi:IS30 family transposase